MIIYSNRMYTKVTLLYCNTVMGFILSSCVIFFMQSATFLLSLAINRYSTGRIRKIRVDEMFMIVSIIF